MFCAPTAAGRVCARQRTARRRLITGSPSPRNPPKERQGPPRCLDRPLRACRGRTPRRVRASPRPPCISRGGRSCLQARQHPGHPGLHSFRGCISHGPHARVPTLRRSRYRDRRQARYRPGRAHPWPGGICTRWTMNEVSSSHSHNLTPLRPALPGRTIVPISSGGQSRGAERGISCASSPVC